MRSPNFSRRELLRVGGLGLAGLTLGGCDRAGPGYADVARGIWRHGGDLPDTVAGVLTGLVRYATLAPSTYNSQCWRFEAAREAIRIFPDPERRSPAVDPDDHHLHVSLGCAAENIVQIAASIGLVSFVETGAGPLDGVTVRLEVGVPQRTLMAEAIPARQTTRTLFDGRPVSVPDLTRLERVARAPGVTPVFVTDLTQRRRLLDLAMAANREWYADAGKLAELERWTRFDDASAISTLDGLAPGPSGRTPLPTFLGSALFGLLATADRENDRLLGEVRSSAGLLGFVTAANDRAHWVETGRGFQRFALMATALGIRHAWVNAPADLAGMRQRLGMELGEPAGRASLLLRFGHAPPAVRSLRRPLSRVLRDPVSPAGAADAFSPPDNRKGLNSE